MLITTSKCILMAVQMLSPSETAWLAGFLEGEGSFGISVLKAGRQLSPYISFQSTDGDVTEKVATLFSTKAHGPYLRKDKVISKKPYFCAAVHGSSAARIMQTIFPYMGNRRKEKIERTLQEWVNRPFQRRPDNLPTLCHPGHRHYSHGLCRKCYDVWFRSGKKPIAKERHTIELNPALNDALPTPWLAGLLEAEGTFGCYLRGQQKQTPVLSLALISSDRDVIQRAAGLMENGRVATHPNAGLGSRQLYVVARTGYIAARLMRSILPFMGKRRSAAIEGALARWDSRPKKHREFRHPRALPYYAAGVPDVPTL